MHNYSWWLFKILADSHPHFQYLSTTSYMSVSKQVRDSLSTSQKYHTMLFARLIQFPKILCEYKMQIKVHDGYIKCLKIYD